MVTFKDLQRLFNRLRIKIMLLMARGVLDKVDNTGKTQKMKISCLKNETIDKVERLQEFGFESYPPADGDTEVLTLFINGTRDIGLIIKAHNRELRPIDLEEGSSCQWGMDADGGNENRITIKPTDNTIEIKTKDGNIVTIDSNGIIITDVNANIVTMDSDGIIITDLNGNTVTMDSSNIKLEDLNGNIYEGSATGVTINSNLEVLQ